MLALVGGVGEKRYDLSLNRAADVPRQIGSTMKPVSYTHLDVYKRQALDGVVKGRISSLSISQRDAAATALSLYKNEDTCLLYTSRCV